MRVPEFWERSESHIISLAAACRGQQDLLTLGFGGRSRWLSCLAFSGVVSADAFVFISKMILSSISKTGRLYDSMSKGEVSYTIST